MKLLKVQRVDILIGAIGCVVALLVVELVLYFLQPSLAFGAASELPQFRGNTQDLSQQFVVDPNFGFRPVLGGEKYSEYGTFRNTYPVQKTEAKRRLLFIGDSVTAEGLVVSALQEVYGNSYEYWNAGVHSFNSIQVIDYYLKYNSKLKPDTVIYTMHMNDLHVTPVAFFNTDKKLVVYSPALPLTNLGRTLFQYSFLYRFLLGVSASLQDGYEQRVQEVYKKMGALNVILKESSTRFIVLLFPLLKDYADWSENEKALRHDILKMLESLDVSYIDLKMSLDRAIADNLEIQNLPGDTWHPNKAMASLIAKQVSGSINRL